MELLFWTRSDFDGRNRGCGGIVTTGDQVDSVAGGAGQRAVSPAHALRNRADTSYTPHHDSTAAALQQLDTALKEFDLSVPIAARMEASPQTM